MYLPTFTGKRGSWKLLNDELEQRVLARTEELRGSAQQMRHLNDQLQQRIAELETIMNVLPVGVSVASDPECRFDCRKLRIERLFEIRPGEPLSLNGDGKAGYDIYQDGRRLTSDELPLQRAAATAAAVGSIELEIHHKSGKITEALASANPLFDESGNVRGAVGAFIDITERKRMEQNSKRTRRTDGPCFRSHHRARYEWSRSLLEFRSRHFIWLDCRRSCRPGPASAASNKISRSAGRD